MTKIKKMKNIMITKSLISLIILSSIILFSIMYVAALPSQPVITKISNETSASAGIGRASEGDEGGYITTITLNATQQNFAWKAYVGNVTGELVLQDQDAYSIYKWGMELNAIGNVYISRNGTVNWGSVNCSDRGNITTEDTFLDLNSTQSKSINKTFISTVHKTFEISGQTYQNSTCPAISTYISGAAQSSGEANKFQEVLLADSNSNLIYMTMLESDEAGFDTETYDFQAIVAENEGIQTTYYFYIELE